MVEKNKHNYKKNGVPFITYGFWSGAQMQGARLNAFNSLKQNIGTPFTLITEENIFDYQVENQPFHSVVRYTLENKKGLSSNHLSDYFRNYISLHHGGAYHDIKDSQGSIAHCWDKFSNPDVWIVGMPPGSFKSSILTGTQRFIARPQTKLFKNIVRDIHTKLDQCEDLIIKHPVKNFKRCCQNGEVTGYPIQWAGLHSKFFHKYQRMYKEHVNQSMFRYPTVKKYRNQSENLK